ncbi:hypothetical protein ACIHFE_29270 [Streptomyces sp. NPDC052396]|uniref:hypothetical protein n=1 Tax=Streptomyces sp. NPDC052396 TaxID=3365689 RepID=UPI0037CF3D00
MTEAMDHDRVRRSYDTVAEEYRERISGELTHKPLDRALLTALIEARLERTHYPPEAETRRGYLLARRDVGRPGR